MVPSWKPGSLTLSPACGTRCEVRQAPTDTQTGALHARTMKLEGSHGKAFGKKLVTLKISFLGDPWES